MKRVLSSPSLLLVVAAACSGQPAANEAEPDLLHYLSSADFEDNTARIEAAAPFHSVGLTIEVPEQAALAFRLTHGDGAVGDWRAVPVEWSEGGYRTAVLVLDAPASAIELRSDPAPSFVRVELSEDTTLLGEYEGAHDDHEHEAWAARPGAWVPPPHTLAVGDSMYLPYVGAAGCSGTGTLLPGTRDIAEMLRTSFPGARSYGGYNCRKIAGTNTWSVHSTGRAIDLFVTLHGGQADNDLGDPIANYLIENAEYLGISLVIWDRGSWGSARPAGKKYRHYTGVHPHHDHLHIEVTETAALRGTQWFADGRPPPGAAGASCRAKATPPCNGAEVLAPGRVLQHGDAVDSCDGRFVLTMQHDGNLVLYQRHVGAVWSSGTHGSGADRAVMQTDGNLVVYAGGTARWASGTHGEPGAIAAVQSDGNLVVYRGGAARWASGSSARPTPGCSSQWLGSGQTLHAGDAVTSCDGRFQLVMQADGNLVMYQHGVGAVWATGTHGHGATRATMQDDGNLVLYTAANHAVWASGTHGQPGAALAVQSDGNLVIYGVGRALWASGTAECP